MECAKPSDVNTSVNTSERQSLRDSLTHTCRGRPDHSKTAIAADTVFGIVWLRLADARGSPACQLSRSRLTSLSSHVNKPRTSKKTRLPCFAYPQLSEGSESHSFATVSAICSASAVLCEDRLRDFPQPVSWEPSVLPSWTHADPPSCPTLMSYSLLPPLSQDNQMA